MGTLLIGLCLIAAYGTAYVAGLIAELESVSFDAREDSDA